MNCPVCGKQSPGSRCPACGMTASALARLKATSRKLTADGLHRAAEMDFDGALEFLNRALRYDKTNAEARNLIGLICWRRGEAAESVRQWTLSLEFQPDKNRAQAYLQDVKKNERQYAALGESLRLYNEALEQARKGDMEFACARLRKALNLNKNFVRAYLLMALCCIQSNNLKKAEAALDKAAKIEPLRPEIGRCRSFLREKRASGQTDAGQEIRDLSRNFYVQQTLHEPDLKEISEGKRDRKVSMRTWSGPIMQLLLFVLGVLCCFGFTATLYVPAKTDAYRQEALEAKSSLEVLQQQGKDFEAQLQEKDKAIAEYKKQAEQYQQEMEALRQEYQENQAGDQEILLLEAAEKRINSDYFGAADVLVSIDADKLSEEEKDFFDKLFASVQPRVVGTYSGTAYSMYEQAEALEGEAKTEALEEALKAYQKAYFFSRGTEREMRHLFHQANILYQLGRDAESEQMLELFFSGYTGSTSDDLYRWADAIRKALEARKTE